MVQTTRSSTGGGDKDDVFHHFAQSLSESQSDSLPLLDPDDSLFLRYSQHCDQVIAQLDSELDQVQIEQWQLEKNTWALVQALYSERLSPPRSPSDYPPLSPYSSPLSVVQQLIDLSPPLTILSTLRDWLHSLHPSHPPTEIRRGYAPYTHSTLLHSKRSGTANKKLPVHSVTSLEPDAGYKEDLKKLDRQDDEYNRALVRSCFDHVRAGDLDLALDLCRQADQSWRAASLSGGSLFSTPSTSSTSGFPSSTSTVSLLDTDTPIPSTLSGNLNRALWKKTSLFLAKNPRSDPYERALYGAISGDLNSVLPVCETWEEHLWAHVNAKVEESVDRALSESQGGTFWSRPGAEAASSSSGKGKSTAVSASDPFTATLAEQEQEEVDLGKVFEKLLGEKGIVGVQARNPFRVTQTYLCLDKPDELIATFVERLEKATGDTEPETLSHLLRFFAHLVLALRRLNIPLPEVSERLLEAYVRVLEAHDQDESIIASYCAHLSPDASTEAYAQFLLSFGRESSASARAAALETAEAHGLSLPAIACRTVELVVADLSPPPIDLIRSLEWLTANAQTYDRALIHANALTRFFLSSSNPEAARDLLTRLPRDLAGTPGTHEESQVREYLDYESYFDCLSRQLAVGEAWGKRPKPGASKIDHLNYVDTLSSLVNSFHDACLVLLESEWLKIPEVEGPRGDELASIRRILVPHLILALHHVLVDTSEVVPSNLQKALDLVNVVADERYCLYLEFITEHGNGIRDYLELVRDAALRAVGVSGNAVSVAGASGKL